MASGSFVATFGTQTYQSNPLTWNKETLCITAPTQQWQFSGLIKLCTSIKVCAWLTVKCFEIVTLGELQNVSGQVGQIKQAA